MKTVTPHFAQAFRHARQLQKRGRLAEAETALQALLRSEENKEIILQAMLQLYAQTRQIDRACDVLEQLTCERPDQLSYCDSLAQLYARQRKGDRAIACYLRYINRNPNDANGHFNLALLYKQNSRFGQALDHYNRALELGIDQPEEVHSNISLVYSALRQEELARASLNTALEINPAFVPALFNLAALCEEAGEREEAARQFRAVLQIDPGHCEAAARLADVVTFSDTDDPLIARMEQLVKNRSTDPFILTDLHFALGKAYNDCAAFDQAFSHYVRANDLSRKFLPKYDRAQQEALTDQLISAFSADFFDRQEAVSDAAPIFICGMFRSGSTLLEQVLASHPDVTAGGEIEFFVRLAAEDLYPFPEAAMKLSSAQLSKIASDYLALLQERFPEAKMVTDKRPDDFLFLGLIKRLFPNAHIIHTVRNPLDNCLSAFFTRLGSAMSYATDLEDTAHYYREQSRLMAHWKTVFGEDVFEVDYDIFVKDPEPAIRSLLEHCDLPWNDQCLNFHTANNYVKTASVWQVREPLYTSSSGRWRNYRHHLEKLIELLPDAATGAKPGHT